MKNLVAIALLFGISCGCFAQTDSLQGYSLEARRKQAFTLFDLGRQTEALPLLETLAKESPKDYVILERYAMCLLMNSAAVQDTEERKKMRQNAREYFTKARELGDTSQISELVNDIPEDGSFATFSDRKDVDAMMQAGEAAFAKGDYDAALENYQHALALDPKNYNAALFMGDMYFRKGDADNAGSWFAQAIAIRPNAETAYRYWGDALMHQQKYEQAKVKFLDAIVAEPYNRNSWVGLLNWADERGMKLVRPNIVPPNNVEDTDKGANITIDASTLGKNDKNVNPAGAAWLVYPMKHVTWKNEGEFQKHYPDEKTYRHSLAEEMDAFSTTLKIYDEVTAKKKPAQTDPQIAKLQELRDRGFLEPYILIHRADQGMAQDYAAYRDAHRDKVRDYLEYCVVAKTAEDYQPNKSGQ